MPPPVSAPEGPITLHATCVAFGPRGVLILGPSGSGKSSLGLALMAIGASLVSDDQTSVTARNGALIASAPDGLPPLIEARGVGLLRATRRREAHLVLAVDLGLTETARLPPWRKLDLLQCSINLVHRSSTVHFPAAIRQYILEGRQD